jgi:hypothetical protein
MLLLSEGRAGEACEHSNKAMLFLIRHNEVSLTSPMTLHFHLLFYYTFNPLSFAWTFDDGDRDNFWNVGHRPHNETADRPKISRYVATVLTAFLRHVPVPASPTGTGCERIIGLTNAYTDCCYNMPLNVICNLQAVALIILLIVVKIKLLYLSTTYLFLSGMWSFQHWNYLISRIFSSVCLHKDTCYGY